MKKIENLDTLKKLAEDGVDVFIQMNFDFKSSKRVVYNRDTDYWHIYNVNDNTEQELHTEDLSSKTKITEALDKGTLYQWEWD